jgi:hypothetical protein
MKRYDCFVDFHTAVLIDPLVVPQFIDTVELLHVQISTSNISAEGFFLCTD